jgi:vitamin B12 transporter
MHECMMNIKGHNKIKVLCAFVFLWQFSFFSVAQEDSSRILRPVSVMTEMDSVARISVVTSAVPHFVLTEEKLAGLAVNDIGSAMKFIPGAQLKDYGGIGGIKTVSFRSLGASHTGVLVDGVRIPNVQSAALNLSAFEIFGVQQLDFTSGQVEDGNAPASAYLQPNMLAIQTLIATKPAGFSCRVYSNATTISAYDQGILLRVPLGKKFFFGAQGFTRFGKGDYSFIYPISGIETEQRRQNSALFSLRLRAVLGMETEKSKTLFSFSTLNNHQQLPGAIILYNPSNDQQLWNEDYRASVVHEQKIGRWKLNVNGFYQSAYTHYYDPHFLNLKGFIDDTYLQQNSGGGLMLKRLWLKDKGVFFLGSDVVYSNLDGRTLAVEPQRMENNSVLGLTANLGRLVLESNLTTQHVNDKVTADGQGVTTRFFETSPFVSMSWRPFRKETLRIRSFYKRSFQLPTFNDLYYNFIGNSNLRPEKANLCNLGVSYTRRFGKWTTEFSADGFCNTVYDKIVAIPTKDIFNWSMQNIGMVRATGLDAGFLIHTSKGPWKFTLNGSYTYNLSLDMTDPESSTYEQQIPYTPFRSGTAGLAVSVKKISVQANAIHSGFRYSLNENNYANYLPPFTDLSANVSFAFAIGDHMDMTCRLAAMNVLGKNYEVIRSFPMPGRYYQVTLQMDIQ